MGFPSLLPIITAANAVINLADKIYRFVKSQKGNNSQTGKTGIEMNGGETGMTTDTNMQKGRKNGGILGLVDGIGGSLGGNKARLAKKEEVERRRKQVENSLVDIGTQKILMGQNVERVLLQARKKGINPAAKRTLYIKWRIAKQQYDYLNTMYENLLMIQARMQISDMTVEFGEAIGNATAVLRQNNKETPDFSALMKRFNQQIAPVNEMIGSGFEDMTKMLLDVEMPADGLYSESSFEAAVSGETAPSAKLVENDQTETDPGQKTPITAQQDNIEETLKKLARDLGGK